MRFSRDNYEQELSPLPQLLCQKLFDERLRYIAKKNSWSILNHVISNIPNRITAQLNVTNVFSTLSLREKLEVWYFGCQADWILEDAFLQRETAVYKMYKIKLQNKVQKININK